MNYFKKALFVLSFIFINVCSAFSQGFYDLNTIQTIEVSMSQSNWNQLLNDAYSSTSDYIMADSVTINGITFDSVGVKYKGNSSYNRNNRKNPWHIELDTYKDHDYQGYKDIKLANCYKDPSFLRDVLSYNIIRKYMDAPLANFANLYVNGELIGLYSNTESITKTFVKSRFGSKSNAFFSCSPPDGASPHGDDFPNLVYLGQDSTNYFASYEMKSDNGWHELIDLCNSLENNTDVEKILDIDKVLWMLAFDNLLVNLDSYIGIFSQNYYLYRDEYGRFLPVVWDLNESFGVFSQTGVSNLNNTSSKQRLNHFLHLNDTKWPLINKLLNYPSYKKMYLAHMKTIIEENFENNSYYATGESLQALISPSVEADNNKFFTHSQFINNLNSDIMAGGGPMASAYPGITNLMDGRTNYLLAHADFTNIQPNISEIKLSDDEPEINQSISITALVSDASSVYLKYRTEVGAPFAEKQMFDDGLHNDNDANDNIFGAELDNLEPLTEYYLYAENEEAAKFSPQRAAFEFYSFSAKSNSGLNDKLAINEFLASNDATVSDQDGDYDDWIELFNNSSSSIDLAGYYLSDDDSDLMQWAFPAGTVIEANGYLIIWADEDEEQSGLHANFKLSASGESVILTDATGELVDRVDYPEQTTDVSYGRYPNGTGDFQEMSPTFNSENILTNNGNLAINEFLASNDATVSDQDGDYDDWIELYNNSSSSIDLAGYYLSDDDSDLMQWAFPAGTVIEANGYLIIWADEDEEQSGLHANFKLSASGESVILTDATGELVDRIDYPEQTTDVSYGRYPNGTGDFQEMSPTFNAENTIMTSIAESMDNNGGFIIYPNPASEVIHIIPENFSNSEYLVINSLGQIVLSGRTTSNSIKIENLPIGVYYLRINDIGYRFIKN